MSGLENSSAFSVVISAYACPSDIGAGYARALPISESYALPPGVDVGLAMSFTSYSGSFGSLPTSALPELALRCQVDGHQVEQNNGVFRDCGPIRLSDVTDGLSTTIFLAEKGTGIALRLLAENPVEANRYGWWVNGNFGDSLFSQYFPPNAQTEWGPGSLRLATSSFHPGGIQALFGDGSARFVADSINSWDIKPLTRRPVGLTVNRGGWYDGAATPGVWQALGTRAGGETVDPATAF